MHKLRGGTSVFGYRWWNVKQCLPWKGSLGGGVGGGGGGGCWNYNGAGVLSSSYMTDLWPKKQKNYVPNTLLKPKRHSLRCHGFVVHALLLRMNNNVVDFRVMRRLCHREWNWQGNWQSVNHIPRIYDNGPRDQGVWRLTLTAYYRGQPTPPCPPPPHQRPCINWWSHGGRRQNIGIQINKV